MKTIKLFGVLTLLCVVISCGKNKQEIINEENNHYSLKESGCDGWPPQILVRDFRFIGDIFCTYPCMNCFYPVVIHGCQNSDPKTILYNSFISHLENSKIEDFFDQEDYSLLFPYLSTDTVSRI